jgi:hypothetical protein
MSKTRYSKDWKQIADAVKDATCDFRLATCFYPCFNQMVYEYIAI